MLTAHRMSDNFIALDRLVRQFALATLNYGTVKDDTAEGCY